MREVHVEQRISAIASGQHGLITTAQLRAIGIDKSAISRRVQVGRLHRVHRAVYAVGHAALSLRAKWKAATLACGEGSALSHRSAAELWRMLEPLLGLIHVSVLTPGGRVRRDELHIHRVPSLQATT